MIADEKWIAGDKAIGEKKKKISAIVNSNKLAEIKINELGVELEKTGTIWNTLENNRILTKMNRAADEAFEKIILDEIKDLAQIKEGVIKKKRLVALLKLVDTSFWLADEFKVSLRLAIAFAKNSK